MLEDVTFTDCLLWAGDRFESGKLCISGGYILDVNDFDGVKGREVPCNGLAIMPCLIDNHVHFREPGAEEKEGFRSGSAASAHGGSGTVIEVQNSLPLLTTPGLVEEKKRMASDKSVIRIGFYASADAPVLDHMNEMAGMTSGLKLFMAPSHGDKGCAGEETIRPYFQLASRVGFHLIVHAEDGDIIREEYEKYKGRGPAFFSRARPPAAEIVAVERALRLAEEYGTRLHVFHVTTAGAVDMIAEARARGVDVTCSTCPHYLFFTEKDVADNGGLFKVYPSIKSGHDRERLFAALREGDVEIVSTDHAPHKPEDKTLGFDDVPAGISSADLLLPLMCTLVAKGHIGFDDVERLCLRNPAKIHGLMNETDLRPKSAADLVFFHPEEKWIVREEDFLSKANLSPYLGMELTGRVAATLVQGRTAFLDRKGPLGSVLQPPA